MIGIIDVGGGLRAIYGAGVFDYLIDNHIEFPYCIGISAGSANVASYMAKQKGRNLKFYIEYSLRKDYMSLKNFIKKGTYLDLDYIYSTLSNSDGEYPLDYDAFTKANGIIKVVAADARSGKPVYFDSSDIKKDDYSILKASCAIPVVCKPYYVKKVPYFDGGIADPIPIDKAFSDGCDRIVVILTKPLDYIRSPKRDQPLVRILKHKYPDAADALANRYIKYNDTIKRLKNYMAEGKIIAIAPDDCCGVDTLTKNPDNLKMLYQKGYQDAAKIKTYIRKRKAG